VSEPARGQDTAQVTAARRLIEVERKTIFFAMHPTATLIAAEYNGVTRLKNGFEVTYTFKFKGFAGNYYSKMDFQFTDKGQFSALATNSTSSWVDPFFASDLALGILKDMIKDDFEMKKDGLIAKALDAADAKVVLELMLGYKQIQQRAVGTAPKDDELIKLIRGSESMDDKERDDWINLLPKMSAADRAKLSKILVDERDALAAIDRKYAKELDAIANIQSETKKGSDLLAKDDYRGAIEVLTAALRENAKDVDAYYYRGQAYHGVKDYTAAVADYSAVLDRIPKSHAVLDRRAHCYCYLKNYRGANLDYSRAVELAPQLLRANNNLAWFLATCPDAKYREGKEAVLHATRACELSGWKEAPYFDTLAAAHAENGSFDKAVEWQEKALADPVALEKFAGKDELEKARARLTLFKDKKAFREVR